MKIRSFVDVTFEQVLSFLTLDLTEDSLKRLLSLLSFFNSVSDKDDSEQSVDVLLPS